MQVNFRKSYRPLAWRSLTRSEYYIRALPENLAYKVSRSSGLYAEAVRYEVTWSCGGKAPWILNSDM
jgi:hypothetical protein